MDDDEPFPTLPGAKPKQKIEETKTELVKVPQKSQSIFETGKFESAPVKEDNEAIILAKGGKKGKGKPVAVQMKGGFW
jgi:hypothetical protein